MRILSMLFKSAIERWDHFWFVPRDLVKLACMRIVLCSTMLYMYIMRAANLDYYGPEAWLSREHALSALPELYRPLFSWALWPDSWNLAMHTMLVVILGFLTFGIGGRVLMMAAWIISSGFIQRNYAMNFGADIIATLFLFYMSFTQACARLSVVNFFKEKTIRKSDMITSLMMRMMQVQICVLYAYTGFEKLKGASWWDGTALWSVLANPQMTTMDFSFLRNIPWVLPVLAYSTIIFEIYFPVMVAWPKYRNLWLLLGVLFHAGIAICMGLGPFATTMVSTYFLFLDPDELKGTLRRLGQTSQIEKPS